MPPSAKLFGLARLKSGTAQTQTSQKMGAARPFRQAGEMWCSEDSESPVGATGPVRYVIPRRSWSPSCLLRGGGSGRPRRPSPAPDRAGTPRAAEAASRRLGSVGLGGSRRAGDVSVRACVSPPLLVAVEKALDIGLCLTQRLGPAVEQAPAFGGQLVGALGRPGEVGAPLGADDTFGLERAEEAVEVADVDAPLPHDLREPLDQLVTVQRPLTQEQQERRLDEALHASANVPVARPGPVSAADSARVAMSHSPEYMSNTYV